MMSLLQNVSSNVLRQVNEELTAVPFLISIQLDESNLHDADPIQEFLFVSPYRKY